MYRRTHRANLLAWCVFALLARHRLKISLRIRKSEVLRRGVFFRRIVLRLIMHGVIAVDADPMHLAAAHHLIFAYYRNIVFALASHHACVAAIALGGVDGHRPLVALIEIQLWVVLRIILVQRHISWRRFVVFARKVRILLVLFERRRAQNLAAFHVVVILGASERIIVAGHRHFAATSGPKRIRGAHRVRIESLVRTGVPGLLPPVTQRKNHDSIRLPRHHPRRRRHLAVRKRDIHHRRTHLAVLAAARHDFVRHAQFFRGRGTHQRRVVPGNL